MADPVEEGEAQAKAEGEEAKAAHEEEEPQEEEHDDDTRAVSSTMVGALGYDRANGLLLVDFVNGHSATYPVTPNQWDEVKQAPSVGQWMHQNVL